MISAIWQNDVKAKLPPTHQTYFFSTHRLLVATDGGGH